VMRARLSLLSAVLSNEMVTSFLPSNITEASFPEPVFMKNCFSVPSLSLVVILDVDAKLDPAPAPEIVVSLGSKDNSLATAESIVMLLNLVVIVESLLILQSMKSMRTETTSSC
jgi:hypothetical protein